jgi:hypothetical protein
MPVKHIWTDAQDTQLRRLRSEGATWDMIAAVLGRSRWATIQRGERIGARRPPPDFVPSDDPLREPLPAGDPRSWGAINTGTVLEDTPYPLPFFPR